MLVGCFIMALCAVILGVPNGPTIAYADGIGPEPPKDPAPPVDSTVTAVNPDSVNQEGTAVIVDPKQEVSLWHIAQLLVLGLI